jgi:Fur family zinc uptake transcriptional regulator
MNDTTATLQQAEALCHARGVRLTPQRLTVLRLVCESERPLSAYEILDRMQHGERRPAPPTVYRALDFLLQQGLIHKIESLHAFVGCRHPQHPHAGQFLICTDCGRVNEICGHPLDDGLRQAARQAGFRTRRPVVELLGTCAHCSAGKH